MLAKPAAPTPSDLHRGPMHSDEAKGQALLYTFKRLEPKSAEAEM